MRFIYSSRIGRPFLTSYPATEGCSSSQQAKISATERAPSPSGPAIYLEHRNRTLRILLLNRRQTSWVDVKHNYTPVTWWEYCVKPNIKKIAIQREREIHKLRRQELEALQLKFNFYLNKVKNTSDANYEYHLTKYEIAKKNLQSFYQERSKIILFQNRAEIFNMSDSTSLYHF